MGTTAISVATITPGAGIADATNLTANTFLAIQGGTTTQVNKLEEIYIAGLAASTAPMILLLGRDSTVGATLSPLISPNSQGLTDPSGAVVTAPPVGFINATTLPQRSATITQPKLNFGLNLFGGVTSRNYANTQDRYGILGNASSLGEMSWSAFTGSTAASACSIHMIIETI